MTEPRRETGWLTVALSTASCLAYWSALPPCSLAPLAWFAPVGWLVLIRHRKLVGKRPYRTIWFTGLVFWVILLYGITMAHPANYLGLLVLGAYLACYFPLFVGLTRVAYWRFGVPLWLAAPAVWTGLELARGHVATGFSVALLAHTQVTWTALLQISDLCGAYGVSFLIVLTAAGIATVLPQESDETTDVARVTTRGRYLPLGGALSLLLMTLVYGHWRLGQQASPNAMDQPLRVGLVQGSVDTRFDVGSDYYGQAFESYRDLNRQLYQRDQTLDLVIWPESAFEGGLPDVRYDTTTRIAGLSQVQSDEALRRWSAEFEQKRQVVALESGGGRLGRGTFLLVGTSTHDFRSGRERVYNSALLIDDHGRVVSRYTKMHPVLFGEYIPGGASFPALYDLFPIGKGLSAGVAPTAMTVAGLTMSPSICFETTVPHLLRRQALQLEQREQHVDLLVNLTNDGWFYGSTILDLHFDCSVFRAIEHRCPLLIAANTGFSGLIDGSGRVQKKGQRRSEDLLVAEVHADPRRSLYQHVLGDWPAAGCLVFTGLVGLAGLAQVIAERKSRV